MAELCIELEGWVTVKEIHDKFSPISCLCFFHRKQWHFTKLFIFETACSDKIWIWTLSYSGLLLCVLFETSYSELSGLGYKLWNLFCPLNEWPEKQSLKLGFLLGVLFDRFQFLLFASLIIFGEQFGMLLKTAGTLVNKTLPCAYESSRVLLYSKHYNNS